MVVRGTVFARFSPEQKQQLVESLQDVGSVGLLYFTYFSDDTQFYFFLSVALLRASLFEALLVPFVATDVTVVGLSDFGNLLKPLHGMRCHLAETLM